MGVGFEGSWWLLVFVCVPVSHLAWNLRILLPFVLLHGTRRTSSLLSCLLHESVSCPFLQCPLQNYFAWHIRLLLEGWYSFIRNLESTDLHLSLSVYPESTAQEKAWVAYSFSSDNLLLLCPCPLPLNFTSLWQFVCAQPLGRKPEKNSGL